MDLAQIFFHNLLSFVAIISVIVFIHELGHFLVARLCGVKVEQFSIGMGKEIFGFNDKTGTRWKICWLPVGGYVKMFGDRNASSAPDSEAIEKMTNEEKKQSFVGKNVYQRFAIVAAGPIFNFILAIIIFTFLFDINGSKKVLPIVDSVVEGSAASKAGIMAGDEIIEVEGSKIRDFQDIRQIVATASDVELRFIINRSGEKIDLLITPQKVLQKDLFGEEVSYGTIGVMASKIEQEELNFGQSFVKANIETYQISKAVLKALGELITGKRDLQEMGGPIKIAKYSGKSTEMGFSIVLWFAALISINLGVMNLLPVPVLDGGHLLFYLIEMLRGKPLSTKTQEYAFRFGFSIILTLMLFTTFNDLTQIFK